MARDLTPAFITEITADALTPILMIAAHFDSGSVYLWNGNGDLVYGGNTYIGTATILNVDKIQEQKTTAATGFNLTLSGLDASIAAIADNEPYPNRTLDVFLGMLDSAGAVIASPYQIFSGFMDTMVIRDDGRTATVQVAVENELISLERARDSKYTPADQAINFPNDTGFNYVAPIQTKTVIWG